MKTKSDEILLGLHQQAFQYFLENQLPHGLILDRQRNHGRRVFSGLCSLSATGMGLIAYALSTTSREIFNPGVRRRVRPLLTKAQAKKRIKRALNTALSMPHEHGMLPHFVDAKTLQPVGSDVISTVDSAWLFAGALWAAEYLNDDELRTLSGELFNRVDWRFWLTKSTTKPLLSHGMSRDGKQLNSYWDRFNAEALFMYVLATGARKNALEADSVFALEPGFGKLLGKDYLSPELGLFVFQYSMELLNKENIPLVDGVNLPQECRRSTLVNQAVCSANASKFRTFRRFWGLSAGDGPGSEPQSADSYRAYSPLDSVDGTAHLTATLGSIGVCRELVVQNVVAAERSIWRKARGRYGYSNVNVDRNWFSRDVVGIDLGMAVLAIENALFDGRVRQCFHKLDAVKRAVEKLSRLAMAPNMVLSR